MRLFVAVNIPQDIKEKISDFLAELNKQDLGVKWVDSGNLHLTLKFIGEAPFEKISGIEAVIKESAAGQKPFRVNLSGTGVFPDIHRPRVVWIGIGEGGYVLKNIALKLETLGAVDGNKEERAFSAHVTIGRIKSIEKAALLDKKLAEFKKTDFGSFTVENIDLMESVLHPGGPEYKCIRSITIS